MSEAVTSPPQRRQVLISFLSHELRQIVLPDFAVQPGPVYPQSRSGCLLVTLRALERLVDDFALDVFKLHLRRDIKFARAAAAARLRRFRCRERQIARFDVLAFREQDSAFE